MNPPQDHPGQAILVSARRSMRQCLNPPASGLVGGGGGDDDDDDDGWHGVHGMGGGKGLKGRQMEGALPGKEGGKRQ